MNYTPFSKDLWSKIELALACAQERENHNSSNVAKPHKTEKLFAAFDADGTLWDTDLGENFFKYEIEKKLLPNLPINAWQFYRSWKAKNPRGAYLWLAQIHRGIHESEVLNWAEKALPTNLPVFPEMQKLIKFLTSQGVEVYIVTASVSWAVKPAADLLGLSRDRVIGVETAIENGIVTDKVGTDLTYRKGKADAILKRSNGRRPFFCAGNTLGDFDLLMEASELALAITSAPLTSELYSQELKLQDCALERCWLAHKF